MQITLITPPSPFLLDERVFISLGILKVGAVLEQAGHSVAHLDLNGVANYEDVVHEYCKGVPRGSLFALTATTPQVPAAMNVLRVLKQYDSTVILGGPHVTLVNAAAKQEADPDGRSHRSLAELRGAYDALIAGDGEKAILSWLVDRPRMVDADQPSSVLWQTSQDFTESPWPARHLVDVSSYHYSVDGQRALSLISQLGCPFECGFCGGRMSPMLRRIRTRPADSVIEEMKHLHETYNIRGLMFHDDELNVNKQVVSLMRSIAKMGIEWRLRGFVKAELFTEEQAECMYAAGFRQLLCGFESAHPKILKNINKKATLEDNTRMLKTAQKHGLTVKALMSFGHPGESEETILATRDWLLENKPDDFDCTVITTYPGTPYFDRAVAVNGHYAYEFNGEMLYSEDVDFTQDAQYYKGRSGEYKSFVWTDHLKPEQITKLRDEVEHEVRGKLGIPYPSGAAALNFEHSMGQNIPSTILRRKA